MNYTEIKTADGSLIMNTYARFPIAIEKGKGAICTDFNGRDYIDFAAGIGVNSLGYCDEGWVDAVCSQAKQLQHVSNLYYSEPQLKAAKRLINLSKLSKVSFCNSGAEANECAIKIARKYSFDKYGGDRNIIITLCNSFHGRTITTLSATGQDSFHNYFFPFTEGFAFAQANNFSSVLAAADVGRVCAVMVEVVQGEGGVLPLSPEFVDKVYKFARENDILFIADEVQTGIGRTGKVFGYEHFGILPDIVTSAKGLGGGMPIGACLVGERVKDVLTPGTHGTTFGANPIAMAAADYVLSKFEDMKFLSEIEQKGLHIQKQLESMCGIIETRGKGMMIGAVLNDDNARAVAERALQKGLLILTAKTALRLLPPLNISTTQLESGLEILRETLCELYN